MIWSVLIALVMGGAAAGIAGDHVEPWLRALIAGAVAVNVFGVFLLADILDALRDMRRPDVAGSSRQPPPPSG